MAVVCGLVLVAVATAHADPNKSVGLLPIRSRWTPPADAALVADIVTELGGELGVDIQTLDVDDTGCWRQRPCYIDAVARAGVEHALAIEVLQLSSGHLHIAL